VLPVRPYPGYFLAVEIYIAFLRLIKTIQTIQDTGLARPVRPDDRQDFMVLDIQVNINKAFAPPKERTDFRYVSLPVW